MNLVPEQEMKNPGIFFFLKSLYEAFSWRGDDWP